MQINHLLAYFSLVDEHSYVKKNANIDVSLVVKDNICNIEYLLGITADKIINAEYTGNLAIDKTINIEYITNLLKDNAVLLEYNMSIGQVDSIFTFEFLSKLVKDGLLNLEYDGSTITDFTPVLIWTLKKRR